MQIKIETEILGNLLFEEDMKFKLHPYEINIESNSEIEKPIISINKKITNYLEFLPKIELNKNNISSIILPKEDYINEQIEILKHIESFGAIDKGIKKINWDNCKIIWTPENEIEEKELPIREYSRNLNYNIQPKIISKDWLRNTVLYRKQLQHLSLPFSFYRAGVNYYHSFQYQEAFINFYLMLEGFFANNQFKNEKVKSEFKKSIILKKSINSVVLRLKEMKDVHYEWFITTCEKYNKKADENGIIHFLVELRGNLSHFSMGKPNKHRNPFADKDFHSLAFIIMSICLFASIDLRLEPFRKEKLYC